MSIAPDPLPQDVLDELSRGNAINAIKLLRQSSGLGLKEAKDAIDAHPHGHPSSAPAGNARGRQIAPGEISRKSGAIWWVVAAIVMAAVAYQFLRSHA